MDRSIFDAAGGMAGIRRLAEAWHARVMADEVVSHAFSHGFHPQHTERLAAYWAEALGGPAGYSEAYGDETSVVRMHSGNGVHEEMDRRAIACFDQALVDAGLAADDQLRQALHDYFAGRTLRWRTTESADESCRTACGFLAWLGRTRHGGPIQFAVLAQTTDASGRARRATQISSHGHFHAHRA